MLNTTARCNDTGGHKYTSSIVVQAQQTLEKFYKSEFALSLNSGSVIKSKNTLQKSDCIHAYYFELFSRKQTISKITLKMQLEDIYFVTHRAIWFWVQFFCLVLIVYYDN